MKARTIVSQWRRLFPSLGPAAPWAAAEEIVLRKGLWSQAKPPIMLEPVTTCHPYTRCCANKKSARLFDRVISAFAPRLAPDQAAHGEQQASYHPVLLYRLVGIIGTRGVEPASRRQQRRHNLLVCQQHSSNNACRYHVFYSVRKSWRAGICARAQKDRRSDSSYRDGSDPRSPFWRSPEFQCQQEAAGNEPETSRAPAVLLCCELLRFRRAPQKLVEVVVFQLTLPADTA